MSHIFSFWCICDGSLEKWNGDSREKPDRLTAQFARWAPNSCPSWDRPNLSEVKRWCNIHYTSCFWKSLISCFVSFSLRYVSAVVQWCDWVKQTDQSMSAVGVALSDSAHCDTPQPITYRYWGTLIPWIIIFYYYYSHLHHMTCKMHISHS